MFSVKKFAFLAELSRARSGSSAAPRARKFGYQCIQEILVLKNRPYVCTYIHPIHVSRGESLRFKHPLVSGVNRMATRTFREKKYNNNKADYFFPLNFNVYINADKRERARRRNKKQRRPSSLEEKRENFIAVVRK